MAAIQTLTPHTPITGGILAGGEGRRLAGADKGLVRWRGQALVQQVLAALKPQTTAQVISANRNLDVYACFGVTVVRDGGGGGPLAGLAALLASTETDWLFCVPCDAPLLPADLASRLLERATSAQALASFLHDGERAHPTFCLVHRSLTASALEAAAQSLGLGEWLNARGAVPLRAMAPPNLNTVEDFAALDAALGAVP